MPAHPVSSILLTLPLTAACALETTLDGSELVTEAVASADEAPLATTGESPLPAVLTTTVDPTSTGTADAENMTGASDPSGAGDDDAECEPGEYEDCAYTGPPGTENVGICRAGGRGCNGGGTWTKCKGEVRPKVEDCRTLVDENCDGMGVCRGEAAWAWSFGEVPGAPSDDASLGDVAAGRDGSVWFTGDFVTSLQIGDHGWSSDGDAYFIAQLDSVGDVGYAFGDEQSGADGAGRFLRTSASGDIAFTASVYKKLAVADGAPSYDGEPTATSVVGVRDAAGAVRWSRKLPEAGDASIWIRSVALDGDGFLWAGGYLTNGDAALGAADESWLVAYQGELDAILIKMDPGGEVVWAQGFGDAKSQIIHSVDVDADGNVWLAGEFSGLMKFTGGALHAGADSDEEPDMFVVKLDASGAWQWGRQYGDESRQSFAALEVDRDGHGIVIGDYRGKVLNLGAPATSSQGAGESLVVAKFDGDGDVLWAKHWPCTSYCRANALAVDAAGQSVLTAWIAKKSAATIAAQKVVVGEKEVDVLVKLDRDGGKLWPVQTYPVAVDLAVGPLGEIFLAGSYSGQLGFGADNTFQIDSQGVEPDLFVAKLRP